MTERYEELREDYDTFGVDAGDLDPDPVAQAKAWLDAAIAADVPQPNAASLATADATGRPSVRTVLLKGIDRGFVVYTDYESRKGRQLAENPRAALSLTWVTMHRSIRVEGDVERTTAEESDRYFASRPRAARISAVVSRQSQEIADRRSLEHAHDEAGRHDGAVARPVRWGGIRIVPDRIEFWQGRRNRLHDRIEYLRDADGWRVRRLSP